MTFDQINEWRTTIRQQRKVLEGMIEYCNAKLSELDGEMDATFAFFDDEYNRTWPELTPLTGRALTHALHADLAQLEAEQETSDVA